MPNVPLFALMLACPLVGVQLDELAESLPVTAHRIEMDGIAARYNDQADYVDAVCGARVKVVGGVDDEGHPTALGWKDLRTRGTPIKRCPTCRDWRRPKDTAGSTLRP